MQGSSASSMQGSNNPNMQGNSTSSMQGSNSSNMQGSISGSMLGGNSSNMQGSSSANMQGSNSSSMQSLYDDCQRMMFYHVVLRMRDGREFDGIIESMEPDSVNLLMGEDVVLRDDEQNRQRPYNNPRRFRRFRRTNFPLATLLGLSLLPYPYYAPPYPYAQPYPYYPYGPYSTY